MQGCEEARQALRAAIAGQQAQTYLRLAELRERFCKPVMAGERELEATTQRNALDRRDAGLVHCLDLAKGEVGVAGQHTRLFRRVDLIQELPDVGARDEGRGAFASEDHRLHVVTAGEVLDDDVELVQRALVQRVDRRIGDIDGRDAGIAAGDPVGFGGKTIILYPKVTVAIEQALLVSETLADLPCRNRGRKLGDRLGIAQRRCVAYRCAFHHRAHHPAHILAAARLRELRDLDEVTGHRQGALLLTHELTEPAPNLLRQLPALAQPDEGERRQALFTMRRADDKHVADRRVRVKLFVAQDRALDLLRAHTVPRDVDHVVAAAVQREAAVLMAHREVALRVGPGSLPPRPI